ncbi:MAG: MarR family transcriptional regulator [Candidatus Poribacteria bacterium]|nr:MarR family transcriptional regulator [Candidatus Poribacteria bacterium]
MSVEKPEFNQEIDVVMRVMHHAQAAVKSRFIQEVVPNRLTIVQFNALQHLHWYGRESGMSVSELGEHLGLAHNTVSGLVSRLEKHGWVVRRKCDEDRRRARIQLTPQSEQLFRERVQHAADFWQNTFGQLSPEERENLIGSLKKLKQVMAKPVWPSYAQLHPRDADHLREKFETELDELAQAKLKLVGIRLILAQIAEKQNEHELAAYLNQAASEEIKHTNQLFNLLGHGENFDKLLSALVDEDKAVYEELLALLDDAPCAEEDEELVILQQMLQDSHRYKRWFRSVHKQKNR